MKQTIKSLLLSFAAMLFVVSAFAQVTTSTLNGRVADKSGEPIAGAAVVAVHTPSGTQYYAVANAEGRYTINGMRAGGPYTVEVSCLGFQNVTYTDVTLQLAEAYALNVELPDDSEMLSEAIVISDAASKFATEKTGAATNINSNQITALPTVTRNITDVTRLSPYGGNGMTFAGADGRTANFTVDGANFNNNFGLNDGLPGGGNPISIDAIEEMQVVISPYDVRQTNFIGGGVNAITKSGTNTFRGTAYIYHRNENLHGDTVDGEQIAGARAIDRHTTYGFTLGGPIVKNKLFFFVNAEYVKIPTIANRWQGSTDGKADADKYISRTRLDDLKRVSDFAKSKYGYDTGSWTNFPADENNLKLLARIDWNINDKHKLAFRYNYTLNNRWSAPNATSMDGGSRMAGARMSQYSMSFANSMYSQQNVVSTFSVDLNSRLSDNLSNQFLATYSKLDDIRGSGSAEFPFIDILDGDLMEDGVGTNNYMALGYELFTWNNAVHNTVANIKDDLTYYVGDHKITGGVNFEYQMADNQYMRNGTGYYRYNSVSDFLNSAAPEVVNLTYGYNGEQKPAARVQFYKAGIYGQDEWNITDKFKLTAGVRLDGLFFNNGDLMTNAAIYQLSYYPRAYGYTEQHIDTGKWPTSKVTVSPRIGFNWDVLGDKSLRVRGGTGLFSGRIPLVFFTNMPTNAGIVKGRLTYMTDPNVLSQMMPGGKLITDRWEILNVLNSIDPDKYPTMITPETAPAPSEVAGVDYNFKMPQVWKSSLAVDYTFPFDFPLTISAEYIFNKTINGVMLTNYNIPEDNAGWVTFNGADNRHIYPSGYRYTTKDAYVLTNTNKGYGSIASISLNTTPVRNLDITAAYTHTVSKEITGMPGSNASAAWKYIPSVDGPNYNILHNSSYNLPDRFMASVAYTDAAHNHWSLFYEGLRYSGNSYVYGNDLNGDGNAYDLMYIPANKNEIRFIDDDNENRYWEFAAQDAYLTKNAGKYAEAYAVNQPMRHVFDFRFAHDFIVKVGSVRNTLQLSLDVQNVSNLFNSRWGVTKGFNPDVPNASGNAKILKYERTDPDGVPVFSTMVDSGVKTWDYQHSLGNCWYMQIGVKYMFN